MGTMLGADLKPAASPTVRSEVHAAARLTRGKGFSTVIDRRSPPSESRWLSLHVVECLLHHLAIQPAPPPAESPL